MAANSVRRLSSTFRGAPVLNGTAGTLIPVLDACLVNGFGQVSVVSIVVSSGVATVIVGPGDSFEDSSVVAIAGATPAGLNGDFRVKNVTSTSFEFDTSESDGAASGTITAKYAPLPNWEKTYSGTNKAVYRSIDVGSPGHLLRVVDTGTTQATVRGYESMSDVDTGTGEFPLTAQAANSLWQKSSGANSNAVPWDIIGDELIFYIGIQPGVPPSAIATSMCLRGFGFPLILSSSGDTYGTVLSSMFSISLSYFYVGSFAGFGASSAGPLSGAISSPRDYSGVGTAALSASIPFVSSIAASLSGNDARLGSLSSSIDGKLRLSSVFIPASGFSEGQPPRSVPPGLYHCPQTGVVSLFTPGAVIDGTDDLAGRKLLVCGAGTSLSNAPPGVFFVDITGPWR